MDSSGVRRYFGWAALREKFRTSLWIVPVGYSMCAAALAVTLLHVDRGDALATSAWFLYGGQAAGARDLLSTIASSMLTIAGLVFSITILVLQLASSQFSPRVLRTFLEDRVTQRAMGMFLGSFVYAMLLLPQIRSQTDTSPGFVPGLSVYVAFGLALVSVFFFVRYIHHMAHSIRAVSIISRVANETRHAIERLYPENLLRDASELRERPGTEPQVTCLNPGRGGVVIAVDERALMKTALERDLVIELVPRVGEFVPNQAPLMRMWGTADASDLHFDRWVSIGDERTPHQDPLFGFRQLVDIAERALSPGINDPTTATQVLDQLHDLLRSLATRHIPSELRVDREGQVRLVLPSPCWDDYVRLSFEEIRNYGSGSIQVVRRVRTALADLLSVVDAARAAPLLVELGLLDRAARQSLPEASQ